MVPFALVVVVASFVVTVLASMNRAPLWVAVLLLVVLHLASLLR